MLFLVDNRPHRDHGVLIVGFLCIVRLRQIAFAHTWILLLRVSEIAHDSVQPLIPVAMFAAVTETALRFIAVSFFRDWTEFWYECDGVISAP